MASYEVRKILDSREVKDEQGRIKGREFLVLWKEEDDPSWEPIENLLSYKKALKSFYNKHPQLPYPNFLAVNDDQEFDPSQNVGANKRQATGKTHQPGRGRPPKQSSNFPEAKKVRLPVNVPQRQVKASQEQQPRPVQVAISTPMAEERPQGKHKVMGLYVQSSTNEIVFYVQSEGVCSFRNRKWIIDNCIQSLAEFYQHCMVVTNQQN